MSDKKSAAWHQWRSIEDLEDSFDKSADEELRYLAAIWQEQKSGLDQAQLQEFNKKLNREWAIETGLIERAYDLDRGTTELLIARGISEALIPHQNSDSPADIAAILHDHHNAVEGLFNFVNNKLELSVSYIKELHCEMMQNQETVAGVDMHGRATKIPLSHGQFKGMPNNPTTPSGEVHYYCPPEQVDSEIDNLVRMYLELDKKDIPPLAKAAWLHHRFVQIHPFQDGNGRVARCLASLVFIKAGWFPLVILNESRDDYLDALEEADKGDLSKLINLFAAAQKKYFVGALTKIQSIAQKTTEDDDKTDLAVIQATMKKIRQRSCELLENYETAKQTARNLLECVIQRFNSVKEQIQNNTGDANVVAWLSVAKNGSETDCYYKNQIVTAAKHHDYFANTGVYRAWAKLGLKVEQKSEIIVLFHGIGHEYRGVIACVACFIERGDTEDMPQVSDPQILSHEVFQINYKEPPEQAEKRFKSWLDFVVAAGLESWKKSV